MKGSKFLWILAGILTGGFVLWLLNKRQAAVPSGPIVNTGTGSFLDPFVNPFRTAAAQAGVSTSSADRTIATINAAAQAAPGIVKGVSDLFGNIGGLFKSTPASPAIASAAPNFSPGFIGTTDFTPANSIQSADAFFYA